MCGKYENINYMIVTQGQVNNSTISLHLGIWLWLNGRGMVSSGGQNGKFGHSCARVKNGKLYDSWVRDHVVHLGLNVNSSANNCGCVVDGGNAMAVSIIIMLAI